ncbi:hypothetical protein [Caballeronia sp. ATUFL_M2_KS44]|uniref:hypothetical protein n=1 Tax=Caballeronia sp. ATUFL_M2_KS44 TaxID=2921767 RepID=UPI0020298B60|nr:hypothetical protein [Caballeronia sp. ATUFL_M2_KS44]
MGLMRRRFLFGSLVGAVGASAVPAVADTPKTDALSGDAVSVYRFGAAGDGVTDDTQAVQRCLAYAARARCRRVIIGANHVITDLDLTGLYYGGLIIEGANTTHQPGPNHANFIVRGSTSQGLDISGTSGLVLRNLTFAGLPSDAPRCAIFASRVAGSNESYGHSFENVRCYGSYTRAAVYNYAGEVWSFRQGDFRNDKGAATLYFTTCNSLGLVSKFRETDARVRPLTVTSISNLTVYHSARDGSAIWFEQDPGTPPDATVQQIAIEHCYVVARGHARATFRFSDIVGNVRIVACTDESFARADADAAGTCILVDGTRTLRGMALEDNVFFPRVAVIEARAPVRDYRAAQNYVWNKPRFWRFAQLSNATHATLFGNEFFIVTGRAERVVVSCADRETDANNVHVPSAPLAGDAALISPPLPHRRLEPHAGRRLVAHTLPGSGNFAIGQLVWRANPAPGTSIGWVCIESGTLGEIGDVHGAISAGSDLLNITKGPMPRVGCYVRMPSLLPGAQIIAIENGACRLDRVSVRACSGRVELVSPRFAEWGAIGV